MQKLTDKEFDLFRIYLKEHYGINLSSEKKSLLYSRLRTLVQDLGMNTFEEYYNYMIKDKTGESSKKFIDRMSTNHTFFMREKDHFTYFSQKVLPYLEQKHKNSKDIRIWCAGCSTGEEAYILQILMKEYFENKPGWNTQLLATDVSNKVLNIAYRGVYSKESISVLEKGWQTKYFDEYNESTVIVKKSLKKDVVFSRFNFIEDKFNFKKSFQVIFCRNVMIYFDQDTRNYLIEKFYYATETGGYLFIGHSESLNNTNVNYEYLISSVYKKYDN